MKHAIALAAAAVILAGTPARAQDHEDAERLARDYMEHYAATDWDAMAPMMAEDILFWDPTATGQGNGSGDNGYRYEGREATLQALHEFSERYHPITLGFQWDTVFESNNRVVFIGHVDARYPMETPGQQFRWSAPQVTVLTVRDGLIVRHEDFADYTGAEAGPVTVE